MKTKEHRVRLQGSFFFSYCYFIRTVMIMHLLWRINTHAWCYTIQYDNTCYIYQMLTYFTYLLSRGSTNMAFYSRNIVSLRKSIRIYARPFDEILCSTNSTSLNNHDYCLHSITKNNCSIWSLLLSFALNG